MRRWWFLPGGRVRLPIPRLVAVLLAGCGLTGLLLGQPVAARASAPPIPDAVSPGGHDVAALAASSHLDAPRGAHRSEDATRRSLSSASLGAGPAAAWPADTSLRVLESQDLQARATLEVLRPDVQWSPSGAARWVSVPARQDVVAGDRLRTGPGAAGRLVYATGTSIEVGPETGILVQRLAVTPEGNSIVSMFQAVGTTISRIVGLGPQDTFEVETAAMTARPGGTVVQVQVAPEGSTEVANVSEDPDSVIVVQAKDPERTEVVLRPGQRTAVLPGVAPTAPQPVGTLPGPLGFRAAYEGASRRQEERQEHRRVEQDRAEQQAAAAQLGLIAAEAELVRLNQQANRLAEEVSSLVALTTAGDKAASPPNSSFAAAVPIGSLPARVTAFTTNVAADPNDPAPPCGPIGKTLWYTLTPAASGTVVIDTAGSSFHTVLAVYTGSAVNSLTPVACNAGVGTTNRARVSFAAAAGTTYRIQVGGAAGESGSLVLSAATGVPGPPNDNFAAPVAVSAVPTQFTAETDGASTEANEPTAFSCASRPTLIGNTVWYAFTPATTALVRINTFGSSFDTVLAVYTGDALGSLAPVVCNDDRDGTLQSAVTFNAQAGTTYRVQVGGFNGAFGHLVVHFDHGAPPPPNDPFSAPTAVSALPAQFTAITDIAATEPGEPTTFACDGAPVTVSRTVWYAFTPTASGWVAVDTFGSSFDTVVAVYTGNALISLTPVACSNNSSGRIQSHAVFNAAAGVTYRIQIGGANGGFGNLVARFTTAPPPPPNDAFAAALLVTTLPTQVTAATDTASTEPGEPTLLNCTGAVFANQAIGTTVWYQFTPLATTAVAVDTIGSSFNTVVAVYTGAALSSLTPVVCNDNSQATTQSRVSFTAQAGVTYRIQIGGASGSFGNLVARFGTASLPPPNDNLAAAIPVTALPAQFTAVTDAATTEPNEPTAPVCGGTAVPIGNTVWYTFTPAVTVPLTIDTIGSNFDTVVAVYTGPLGPFRQPDVACNDDLAPGVTQSRVSFLATAGITYQIQIGGFGGAFGNLVANFTVTPPPPNDNFAAAIAVSPSATLTAVTLTATTEPGEPVVLDPSCGPNVGTIGRTVWYAVTPAANTTLTIDTLGSSFDTVVAVYTGNTVGSLTRIACNDDAPGVVQSQVTFAATAGTVYRVQVGGFNSAAGDLVVNVRVGASPSLGRPAVSSPSTTPQVRSAKATATPQSPAPGRGADPTSEKGLPQPPRRR
jgi:hypothetical protein